MQCYLICGIQHILLLVYYVVFYSHLAYLCLLWGQAKFSLNRITVLQKRAFRIDIIPSLFFRKYKVQKFIDPVSLKSCIFVNKCFNGDPCSLISNQFKLTASSHSYCARSVSNCLIFKIFYNIICYDNKSIIS